MLRPWTLSLAAAAALLAPPTAARAQGADTVAQPWTEARVLARAERTAPDVLRARAELGAAEAVIVHGTVPVVGNPIVSVRAMIGVPDRAAATWAVLVGLPFDVSGRTGAWRAEAHWAAESARSHLAAAVNRARARAREAYVVLGASDALLVAARERVTGAEAMLTRVQQRLAAESATALDVALAEREVAAAQAEAIDAQRARDEAAAGLRDALDLSPSGPVGVVPLAPPAVPPGLTREAAIRAALARRREAPARMAAATRLRRSIDRLRAESVAPITVNAEYEAQGYEQASVGASASWQLPVIHTAQGERAVALAEANTQQTEGELAARTAAREAGAAWDALTGRLEELRVVRERARPALQRALELTERLLDAGESDVFRVLSARRELAEMRVREVVALREAWRARVALDQAMGGGAP